MLAAGDITLAVTSKVGIVDEDTSRWEQTGAVVELGHPLEVSKILPEERRSIARQMANLVTSLHGKGIIHGAIRPESFAKSVGGDLKIIDFSRAQVLTSAVAPLSSDIFALAVSICSVFTGLRPSADLFNRSTAGMPDLTVITDPELFCSIVDAVEQGGLKMECADTRSRRNWVGMARAVSTSLDLFHAEKEANSVEVATTPRFCPHCFEAARTGESNKQEGSCSKRPVHRDRSASDYAMQWLAGQKEFTSGTLPGQGSPKGRKASLSIGTHIVDENVEKPLWSATSAATVTPSQQRRGRSNTAVRTPSISISSTNSDDQSASQPSPSSRDTSVDSHQLGVGRWSCSTEEMDDASNCSLPPLTPMPARFKLLHMTSSFESVALSEREEGTGRDGAGRVC